MDLLEGYKTNSNSIAGDVIIVPKWDLPLHFNSRSIAVELHKPLSPQVGT